MQIVLIIASLWAAADRAPGLKPPVGPRLAEYARAALQRLKETRTAFDRWAEKTLDVAFDIQVLSLADEAAREIRFAAELDEKPKGSAVIRKERTAEVRSIARHILAAGDARVAAEHTVVTRAGVPGIAMQYVKVGVPYVDPNGIARVGLTRRADGDSFHLHPSGLTLSRTRFSIKVYSGRTPQSVATSEFTAIADVPVGESLLIYREAPELAVIPVSGTVTVNGVEGADPAPTQAALIIVTPRRVVRAGESKPRSL